MADLKPGEFKIEAEATAETMHNLALLLLDARRAGLTITGVRQQESEDDNYPSPLTSDQWMQVAECMAQIEAKEQSHE